MRVTYCMFVALFSNPFFTRGELIPSLARVVLCLCYRRHTQDRSSQTQRIPRKWIPQ